MSFVSVDEFHIITKVLESTTVTINNQLWYITKFNNQGLLYTFLTNLNSAQPPRLPGVSRFVALASTGALRLLELRRMWQPQPP